MKNWNAFDWAWRSVLIAIGVLVFMTIMSGSAIAQEQNKCDTIETVTEFIIEDAAKKNIVLENGGIWSERFGRGVLIMNPATDTAMWLFIVVDENNCFNRQVPYMWLDEQEGYDYIESFYEYIEEQEKDKGV